MYVQGDMHPVAEGTSERMQAAARAALVEHTTHSQKHLVSKLVSTDELTEQDTPIDDCDLSSLQALVQAEAATAIALKAAAALEELAQQLKLEGSQTCDKVLPVPAQGLCASAKAAVETANNSRQLLEGRLNAVMLQAEHYIHHRDALKSQQDIVSRAAEMRIAADAAAAEAKKTHPSRKPVKKPQDMVEPAGRMYKYLDDFDSDQHHVSGGDKKALPASVYYSITKAMLQHHHKQQQRLYAVQLDQLQSELRDAAGTADLAVVYTRPKTSIERLRNLYIMMTRRVAPYHLSMSTSELVYTTWQSFPWLWRTHSQLRLVEEVEFKQHVQQYAQQKKQAGMLPDSAKAAAIAAMSKSARMQLLVFFTRNLLAAEDDQVANNSSTANATQWQGVSWSLFPRGLKRELQSLTDNWRACPDSAAALQVEPSHRQNKGNSVTARHVDQVRAFATSPYPSFEDMLAEELQSSISAHSLQRIMTGGRARSCPAAAAGLLVRDSKYGLAKPRVC